MSKRIVVTGAAGTLGRTVVKMLHTRGIITVGIDLGESAAARGEFIGGVDLGDADAVEAAFAGVSAGGPVDGLVNIAGGFCWETIADGSPQSWEHMFQLNVMTALNACRAVLPLLSDGGSIVNIGAAATVRAAAGMGAYTASKSGVARLTEALAEEGKSKCIRVNAILPSIIDTPANRQDMGERDSAKWVTTEEIGEVIAFLVSDAASGVTGASIPVTGRV